MKMELTLGDLKELMGGSTAVNFSNGMVGKYVVVRCCDAGVHAGFLESHSGRECVLREGRRLWYWKTVSGGDFLNGIATNGLHKDSKVGGPVRIHLTENCEIIECSEAAERSIREAVIYEK